MHPIDNTKNILLYNGYGAEEFCVNKAKKSLEDYLENRSVKLIQADASYFTENNLKDAQAVIIPGGNAVDMLKAFREEGMKKIGEFVFSGGAYIGFCAGGYLAGPFFYQTPKVSNIGPQLISSILYGPAIHLDEKELTSKTARAVLVKNQKKEEFFTFWNGGGYYPCANPGLPIAHYEGEAYNGVAVLYSCQKKGPVIISNVHPEIQLTESEIDNSYPQINKRDFISSIPKQKALFSRICDLGNLGIKKADLWEK